MPKIVQASAIKLNCDTERMRDGYSKVLNQLCNRHRIFSKLVKLKKNYDNRTVAEFWLCFNRWDDELTDLMKGAEDKCRKFKQNHIEFSPEVNVLLTRRWTLGTVKRFLNGEVPDPRNLYKQCEQQDLPDPRYISLSLSRSCGNGTLHLSLKYRQTKRLCSKATGGAS